MNTNAPNNQQLPAGHAPPKFSIVSVVFNAAEHIGPTGQSLKDQTSKDYEWLVIDGASTDDTLVRVEQLGVPNTIIHSAPDRGIYDAMNKGVAMARGEWIYFLNAGDRFVDSGVLCDIAAFIGHRPQLSLVHGDVRHDDEDGLYVETTDYVRSELLLFESLNHQSVFARRALFDVVGSFNLDFRTSADFDWLVRVFQTHHPTSYVPRLIADFLDGGIHSRKPAALAAERRRLREQYALPLVLVVGNFIARIRRRRRIMRRVYLSRDALERHTSASPELGDSVLLNPASGQVDDAR